MKQITIRSVPERLSMALEEERRRRGSSLNKMVIELLEIVLGLHPYEPFDNGLSRLSGTWSDEDLERFTRDTSAFEEVDEDLWR